MTSSISSFGDIGKGIEHWPETVQAYEKVKNFVDRTNG